MLKDILVYQQKDAELVKLDRDLENSQQKKEVNKLVEQVKQAQNKVYSLENTASQLIVEFEQVKKLFENQSKKVENTKKLDLNGQTEAELREAEVLIKKEIGALLALSKEIKSLSNKITQTRKEYDKTTAYGMECKTKYKTSLDAFKNFSAKKNSEREKIANELEDLKKRIDPVVMQKYLQMRDDHKFPILVPLVNQSCAICATPLANARLDMLKKEGMVECENCHRIIYTQDK